MQIHFSLSFYDTTQLYTRLLLFLDEEAYKYKYEMAKFSGQCSLSLSLSHYNEAK